jgi:hypothetical protein
MAVLAAATKTFDTAPWNNPAVPPQLRELAFKGSSVNHALQIRRHGPNPLGC